MNNLFIKEAWWVWVIMLLPIFIITVVWFLPWYLAVKIVVTVIFAIIDLMIFITASLITGPQ